MVKISDEMHNFWIDQGILRSFWSNSFEVASGVTRSNQPDSKRLAKLKKQGIKSIVYLRGSSDSAAIRVERAACNKLNLELYICRLSARRLPSRERILELIDLLKKVEKPMLLHCRAGADRTGLASAIYLLTVEGRSITEAKSMLSARFGHYRVSSTGVLDQLFLAFEEENLKLGITFECWVKNNYDPVKITFDFKRKSFFERFTGSFL